MFAREEEEEEEEEDGKEKDAVEATAVDLDESWLDPLLPEWEVEWEVEVEACRTVRRRKAACIGARAASGRATVQARLVLL